MFSFGINVGLCCNFCHCLGSVGLSSDISLIVWSFMLLCMFLLNKVYVLIYFKSMDLYAIMHVLVSTLKVFEKFLLCSKYCLSSVLYYWVTCSHPLYSCLMIITFHFFPCVHIHISNLHS